MDLGKRPWLHGDLIGSRGYVILYDPEMVVDAIPLLPSYPFPDLDLFQAAGLPREASRRRIPLELVEVGERHTALPRPSCPCSTGWGCPGRPEGKPTISRPTARS